MALPLEINSATGVPQPFRFDLLFSTEDARRLERRLHKEYASQRVRDNREIFTLNQSDLVWLIEHHNTLFVNYDHLITKHRYDLIGNPSRFGLFNTLRDRFTFLCRK